MFLISLISKTHFDTILAMGMTRRLKVMLCETIATTIFRTTTLKLSFLPFDNNVATMLRRCVALIIVVVKRPV